MTQVSLSEINVIRRGNITLAVETGLLPLLSWKFGDSIVVISEEVEGEVTHVLLCRTCGILITSKL